MVRDKFFYASPVLFPKWPYESRYAIGLRLADFRARNKKTFNFLIRGYMYSIDRKKAFKLGLRYMLNYAPLPNIIPIDEFKVTKPAGLSHHTQRKAVKPMRGARGDPTQQRGQGVQLSLA